MKCLFIPPPGLCPRDIRMNFKRNHPSGWEPQIKEFFEFLTYNANMLFLYEVGYGFVSNWVFRSKVMLPKVFWARQAILDSM